MTKVIEWGVCIAAIVFIVAVITGCVSSASPRLNDDDFKVEGYFK